MDHFEKLERQIASRALSAQLGAVIHDFYLSYTDAVLENGYAIESIRSSLNTFLDLVVRQLAHPYSFEIYHEHIRHPFNYTQFGLDLFRPLVLFSASKLVGKEHLDEIEVQLERGDNVILFGNHQTEPDPQAIMLLIEKSHPKIANEMIFVAGHRVTSDPLAVPFSMGINLLCVYSKRHIEIDPALKAEKLLHNQRTMKKMAELLAVGGKCIYIAPSGGRDRLNAQGQLQIAPFDPQSIEMCWLMAKKAGRNTHFYPLSLATYSLLPPPGAVQGQLGERRRTHSTPIHLAFGSEISMDEIPGAQKVDKRQLKQVRSDYIWSEVVKNYEKIN